MAKELIFKLSGAEIRDLLAAEIADNVKKGWEEII